MDELGNLQKAHTDGAEHMPWLLPALFVIVDQKRKRKSALPKNLHAQKSLVSVS